MKRIDKSLWNNKTEILFFRRALDSFASPEQLFYKLNSGYYAYVPKGIKSEGQTLQPRNSLIGQFTEKWAKDFFAPIARQFGLYAVNSVVCDDIGIHRASNADLAFCTTDAVNQKPENIKLIFEIKMSIISNYRLTDDGSIEYVGDYKSHRGTPSLLRSDSMLKAIGKSINIRVSGFDSAKIPIIILGNSPISDSYKSKVDFLKASGVIQGFWSLNPNPSETSHNRLTPKNGFQTFERFESLKEIIGELLNQDLNYFSSMISKVTLGEIIRIASQENTDEAKAEKFLSSIRRIR